MTRSMRRQTAIFVAVLLAVAGLAGSPASAHRDQSPITAIVSLTGSASATALRGVHIVSQLPRLGMVVVSGTSDALQALHGRPGVRGVTPNYRLAPSSSKDRAGSGSVFASDRLNGRVGKDGDGAGVTVAVVDTGITDTPALNRASGRLHDGVNTSGIASFDDGYGHGTFMANLVAGGRAPGSGNRSLGVAPGADVIDVKVADSTGSTSLVQVLVAFSWIDFYADHIDLVEFAFSGARPGDAYGPDPLTDGIERLRASGILSIVSAGNVAGQLGDPGFDPYALTVGAADIRTGDRHVADFSGYGDVYGVEKPDVVASGVGVLSLLPADSVIALANPQSLQPNGLYRGAGTSQASAITAGLAATVLQRYPQATPRDLKATLRSAAREIDGDGAGQGLVSVPERLYLADGGRRRNRGTGEDDLDVAAWLSHSWLDGAWVESNAATWRAATWSSAPWDAGTWRAGTWGAATWSAGTWRAATWGAATWSAGTWGAATWSTGSWSAGSWSAGSWSVTSWS